MFRSALCIITISSILLVASASPALEFQNLFQGIAKSLILSEGQAELLFADTDKITLRQQETIEMTAGQLERSGDQDTLELGREERGTSKDIIRRTLGTAPSPVFYTGANLTGDAFAYHFEGVRVDPDIDTFRNCFKIPENVSATIKSVNPRGTCFRLFSDAHCVGSSLAIYPGSENVPNIQDSTFQNFTAIGPCYRHEFDFSTATAVGVLGESNSTVPEEMSFRILKSSKDPQDLISWDPDSCAKDSFKIQCESGRLPMLLNDCRERLAMAVVPLCNPEFFRTDCKYPSSWKKIGEQDDNNAPSTSPLSGSMLNKKLILPPNMDPEGVSTAAVEGFSFQTEESAQEWARFTHMLVDNMVRDEFQAGVLFARFLYKNEEMTQASGFSFDVIEARNTTVPHEFQIAATYGFIRS